MFKMRRKRQFVWLAIKLVQDSTCFSSVFLLFAQDSKLRYARLRHSGLQTGMRLYFHDQQEQKCVTRAQRRFQPRHALLRVLRSLRACGPILVHEAAKCLSTKCWTLDTPRGGKMSLDPVLSIRAKRRRSAELCYRSISQHQLKQVGDG